LALAAKQVANFYSYLHPEARWTNCLFAALVVGTERHHVVNAEKCVRRGDGSAARTPLGSVAEVLDLLRGEFGLSELPGAGQLSASEAALVEAQVGKGAPPTFHNAAYAPSS